MDAAADSRSRLLRPLAWLVQLALDHLYHGLAPMYDAVAWLVSVGHWYEWAEAALPFVRGENVLELGHGTGHLLSRLGDSALTVVGVDESPQMGRLASMRIRQRAKRGWAHVVRAKAQTLPFPSSCFDTVVSTFPTAYVFWDTSLSELSRILVPGGRFVAVTVAWMTGRALLHRLSAWLFALTGEVPPKPELSIRLRLAQPLSAYGFQVDVLPVACQDSIALVVLAEKQAPLL